MSAHTITLIVLIVVNIPVYLLLGKMIFGDWEGFGEAIGYVLTPDIISLFNGERAEDFFATMKFFFFVALCIGCVYGEMHLLGKYMPNLFH